MSNVAASKVFLQKAGTCWLLALLTRYFDLDRVMGSVLTASTLFQVIRDRRKFFEGPERFRLKIPTGQCPDDRLTGEWLFHRVKHIRKLERVVEDIRESAKDSRRREWDYLWEKIQDILIQDREDSNALSVFRSLQTATPSKAKAAAVEAQSAKAKALAAAEKQAPPLPPPPKAEAPGTPAPTPKPKPKPKAKAKAMTDAENAKAPCIFFRMPSGCHASRQLQIK